MVIVEVDGLDISTKTESAAPDWYVTVGLVLEGVGTFPGLVSPDELSSAISKRNPSVTFKLTLTVFIFGDGPEVEPVISIG